MKKVQEIPFTGTSLVHGDGLALDNHTLYVARNLENTIVEIKLSADFWATLVKSYTNPGFLFPTAVAKAKGGSLVVNAPLNQLSATGKAALPFTVLNQIMKINSFVYLPHLNQLGSKQRQWEWVQASLSNPSSSSQAAPKPVDPFLSRLYALFEANMSDSEFGLEQTMTELGMSRTNLFRKVKALTGLTAHNLLRNYRLKRAAKLLQSGESIQQTAYRVGFERPPYFSKCFRELYQLSPP